METAPGPQPSVRLGLIGLAGLLAYNLNPVIVLYGVGGGHNDLMMLAIVAWLLLRVRLGEMD